MSAPMPPVLAGNLRPDHIDKAIRLCRANASTHHIPLFQAVGAGRIAMTGLTNRLSRPNLNALRKTGRPALILVGDDEGHTTGPLGWVASPQLMSWAKGAVVHGTGGDLVTYLMTAQLAEDFGRLLLIETSSDAVAAWAAELVRAGVQTVCLKPADDGVHPVAPEDEAAA